MRYSIEPKDLIELRRYGFSSFPKNISKSLSDKCSQKLLDSAEKIWCRCTLNCFKKQFKKQV